jgi:outer membrane lipoprotein carrier protein
MNFPQKNGRFFDFFPSVISGMNLYSIIFDLISRTVLILFILLFLAPSPGGAETLSLDQLTTKMQETYENTKDLKARFVQELTIQSLKKTEKEEGTVYFKNPKRMLWDYAKPKAKKLVINPQTAWLYVPEDRIVYVQNAEGLFKSKLTIRFLSGIGRLSEDFKMAFSDPAVDRDGHHLLTLTPKTADLGIDKLYLTIDQTTLQIIKCRFTDMYGNLTRIQFRNIKINNQLPESLFNFKPPRGVEIYNVP